MKTTRQKKLAVPAVVVVLAMLLCMLPMGASAAEASVPESGNTFTFTDGGVTASDPDGSGFEINGTALEITKSGVYTVTGSCAEGSVTVKKGVTGVTLILEDLALSSSETAPIVCKKTTEVTIYLAGTVTLTDNEDPANEDSADEAVADAYEGAAIKVKSGGSLVITGDGTLNVYGNSKNGVKGGATATITVESGTININAENHGLAADGAVVINGGTLNITTATNEGVKASPDDDDEESAGDITINGGVITINAGDDGVHAGGNLTINGGTIIVSAADDGLKAEYVLTINDGEITVAESYEGIEGATVNLNGGSANVTASDDGVNAANGDFTNYAFALNITGGSWYINAGGDGLDSNGAITISGGVTEVYAATDNGNGALDSETGITVTGGTVLAVGMSGMAEVPGSGTYVSFGAGGMMGGGNMGGGQPGGMGGMPGGNMSGGMPSGDRGGFGGGRGGFGGNMGGMPEGGMPGDMGGFGGQQSGGSVSLSAGDTIEIKDSEGNTIYSAVAVKSANSVVFAAGELVEGETYSLYVNGSEAATATAAAGNGGNMGGFPGGQQGQFPGERPGNGERPGDGERPPEGGDVPADWAREEVAAAIETGIVTGNLQHNYQTDVSRGEVAQMFINLIEELTGEDIDSFIESRGLQIDENAFTDTDDHAVRAANALGIIYGRSAGSFDPDGTLKRAEIAAILNRVARLLGVDTDGCTHDFVDVSTHWVNNELGWAAQNGIILGREDGSFDPETAVTTQEAIAFTYRALNALAQAE